MCIFTVVLICSSVSFDERMSMENWIRGKSAIVIGERDGVQGTSIAKCVEAAGGKVVYAVTECFV